MTRHSLSAWCLLCLLWLCPGSRCLAQAPPAHGERPVRVAVLGDPQLGYGRDGLWRDSFRFAEVKRAVNARGVDLVIIPGDLTQNASPAERFLFERTRRDFTAPTLLTAGNHDIKTPQDLADFRQEFGHDWQALRLGRTTFITINSEVAVAPRIFPEDYSSQWIFLEDTLESESAGNQRLVLITHRPPLVSREDERGSDSNWPPRERSRLLELCRQYGVRLIFAGHLHRNNFARTPDGIEVRTLAGSARAHDSAPFGYQLLTIDGDSLDSEFVKVGALPKKPYVVPGFRDWTPRLFDPSLRHSLLTLGFSLTAWACLRTKRRPLTPETGQAWGLIGATLLFFALNVQLDFDELLRDVGRGFARLSGIAPVRHLITGTGLLLGLLTVSVSLYRALRNGTSRGLVIATACLLAPGLWFVLSAVSHHYIGMVLDEATWDVLFACALVTIASLARRGQRGASDAATDA